MKPALLSTVLALWLTGCDPCSGLDAPIPAPRAGDGTRVEVHLPHLGEVALRRWTLGSTGRLERAALSGTGDLVTVSVRPYRLRIDAGPTGEGLVFRSEAEVEVRGLAKGLQTTVNVTLPTGLLVRRRGGGWTFTADPQVLATVSSPGLGDPALDTIATHLAQELIPRILTGRPLLGVVGTPDVPPQIVLEDMAIQLSWPARRQPFGPRAALAATGPSVGNTAAVSVASGELYGGPVEITGPDGPLEATVLGVQDRAGRLWATVRLRESGTCTWSEAAVPVAATAKDGTIGLRAVGAIRQLRSSGLSGDLDTAFVSGAHAGLGAVQGVTLTGPTGTPTQAVLARTGGGAIIKEINVQGLVGDRLTPPTDPRAPQLPRDR